MEFLPIKTRKIVPPKDEIWDVLDDVAQKIKERSVLVVTSKIVSIHEGRSIPARENQDKDELAKRESEYWLPREDSPGGLRMHTITNNAFVSSAGIDVSNANGYWISYPKRPFASAKMIWEYVRKKTGIKELGVLITDSHSQPLRRGTMGFSISYWGFKPLRDYRDTPDIFGRKLKVTFANIADGIAAAATLVMGEGKEQTPIVLVRDLGDRVEFSDETSSSEHFLSMEEDLFRPLLRGVRWRKKSE